MAAVIYNDRTEAGRRGVRGEMKREGSRVRRVYSRGRDAATFKLSGSSGFCVGSYVAFQPLLIFLHIPFAALKRFTKSFPCENLGMRPSP